MFQRNVPGKLSRLDDENTKNCHNLSSNEEIEEIEENSDVPPITPTEYATYRYIPDDVTQRILEHRMREPNTGKFYLKIMRVCEQFYLN